MRGRDGRNKLIGRMASADKTTSVERRGEADEPSMFRANCLCWKRGNKKAPVRGLFLRAWVLSPGSYAAVPMRSPTTIVPFSMIMCHVTACWNVRQLDAYAAAIVVSPKSRMFPNHPEKSVRAQPNDGL